MREYFSLVPSCSLSPLQPTDSLTLRPKELLPPGSPVRFEDLCNGKKRSSTADVSPGEDPEEPPSFGISPGAELVAKNDCVNYVDGKVKPDPYNLYAVAYYDFDRGMHGNSHACAVVQVTKRFAA